MTYHDEKQMSTSTLTNTSSGKTRTTRGTHRHRSSTRPLIVLHSLSVVFSITSILIFIAAIPKWNANFLHSTGPLRGDWADGIPLIALFFCIIFSSYNLTILVIIPKLRKRSDTKSYGSISKVSSGYALSLSTLIILTLPPLLIIAGMDGIFRLWRPAMLSSGSSRNLSADTTSGSGGPQLGDPNASNNDNTSSKTVICNLLNIFAKECQPVIYKIGELQIAGIVCGSLTWLTWFGLWITYCRMWQRDRARTKRRQQRAERRRREQRGEKSNDDTGETVHRSRNHTKSAKKQGNRPHQSKPRHPTAEAYRDDEDLTTLIPKPLSTASHLVRTLPSSRKNHYIPNLATLRTQQTSSAPQPSAPEPAYMARTYIQSKAAPVSRFNTTRRISAHLSHMKEGVQQHLSSPQREGRYTRFDRDDSMGVNQYGQQQWQQRRDDALQAEVRRNARPALTISQWIKEGKTSSR